MAHIGTTPTPLAPRRWGPGNKRGAFSLTFDNLGEAADIELGFFPKDQPIGQHFTATEFLPRLLRMVEGVPVTYFIEASNVALYPEQIKSIRDAGHEVAMHAWRHENWGKQDAARRKDILSRSMQAYETLGIVPKGFRPPGGVMPDGSIQEFLACGLTYSSPLGDEGHTLVQEGLAMLPFAWKHVDAYMLDPRLRALRATFGDPEDPVPFAQWEQVLEAAVQLALQGHHVTLIFHPFLFAPDTSMTQALRGLIRTLQSQPDLWVAQCKDVAQWLRNQPAAVQ